jgi:hypothetical protein
VILIDGVQVHGRIFLQQDNHVLKQSVIVAHSA